MNDFSDIADEKKATVLYKKVVPRSKSQRPTQRGVRNLTSQHEKEDAPTRRFSPQLTSFLHHLSTVEVYN